MDLPIIFSSSDLTDNLEEKSANVSENSMYLIQKNTEKESQLEDFSAWPKVNLGNIFEYTVRMKEFGKEYIGKCKNQKACSYFDSGFVRKILVSKINEVTKLALFCTVQGSMSIHNKKEVWVVANLYGMIITAWCSCMVGASRCCNHVIAVLYKVEYANTNNFFSPACASIPCGWNKSTKKNHRTKKDKGNCCTKKDEIKHGR